MRRARIPDAAIKRLPVYLRILNQLVASQIDIVSSAELAVRTGFSPEQIRKDLAYFGAFGTRGVGYETRGLRDRIKAILGLDRGVRAILVGAGHLGTAFARYSLSNHKEVRIAAIVDSDPAKTGMEIEGVVVSSTDQLEQLVRDHGIRIGIVAVPASAAQRAVDRLVAAGVEAVLNFAPAKLKVPEGVFVQDIDLTMELQSLAYYTSASEAERPL